MNSQIPSGWYPDPSGLNCERVWEGQDWTEQTRPVSILPNRPPPQVKPNNPGFDSSEKTLLVVIVVLIVVAALFSSGY
jgi:hypothetical protein